MKYWNLLLKEMNERIELFRNVSPSNDHWLSTEAGITRVTYNFNVIKSNVRVVLYIQRPIAEENKMIIDELIKHKDQIEQEFGDTLIWDRLDDKNIYYSISTR